MRIILTGNTNCASLKFHGKYYFMYKTSVKCWLFFISLIFTVQGTDGSLPWIVLYITDIHCPGHGWLSTSGLFFISLIFTVQGTDGSLPLDCSLYHWYSLSRALMALYLWIVLYITDIHCPGHWWLSTSGLFFISLIFTVQGTDGSLPLECSLYHWY